MPFIFSSTNDYIGSTCNLSYNTPEDTIFKLKSLLKTAGWTIVAAGSSSTVDISGVDLFPTSASMFAPLSWFAIKSNAGNNSFCFQRSNTSGSTNSWRIKYSPGGYNVSTGTSTKTPSPTVSGDELYSLGDGTDAAPTFSTMNVYANNTPSQFMHIGASNDDGSFWWAIYTSGSVQNGCNGGMIYTRLTAGTYPTEDIDPYVVYGPGIGFGNTNLAAGNVMYGDVGVYTTIVNYPTRWLGTFKRTNALYGNYSFYGNLQPTITMEDYVGVHTHYALIPSIEASYPIGPNPITNEPQLFPTGFWRPLNTTIGFQSGIQLSGFKGVAKNICYTTGTGSTGQTYSTGSIVSRDYIGIGRFTLPWNGSIVSGSTLDHTRSGNIFNPYAFATLDTTPVTGSAHDGFIYSSSLLSKNSIIDNIYGQDSFLLGIKAQKPASIELPVSIIETTITVSLSASYVYRYYLSGNYYTSNIYPTAPGATDIVIVSETQC